MFNLDLGLEMGWGSAASHSPQVSAYLADKMP